MVPISRPGALVEWTVNTTATQIDRSDKHHLSADLIASVGLTRKNLFLPGPGDPLVVPRTAFANSAQAVKVANQVTA